MVFNATINTISVISWQSVLLVEENEVTGENHRPAASHWQTLSHNAERPPLLSGCFFIAEGLVLLEGITAYIYVHTHEHIFWSNIK
jgi:hypothetical protein